MHLLAVPSTSLDETDAAVDLGQTPADIMALSFSDSDLSALAAAWRASPEALPSLRLASLKKLRHPMSVDSHANAASAARLIIVRCLGEGSVAIPVLRLRTSGGYRTAQRILFCCAAWRRPAGPAPPGAFNHPRSGAVSFRPVFSRGCLENLGHALRLAANLLGAKFNLKPPAPMPSAIGLTASGAIASIEDLIAEPADRPHAQEIARVVRGRLATALAELDA